MSRRGCWAVRRLFAALPAPAAFAAADSARPSALEPQAGTAAEEASEDMVGPGSNNRDHRAVKTEQSIVRTWAQMDTDLDLRAYMLGLSRHLRFVFPCTRHVFPTCTRWHSRRSLAVERRKSRGHNHCHRMFCKGTALGNVARLSWCKPIKKDGVTELVTTRAFGTLCSRMYVGDRDHNAHWLLAM